MFFRLNFMGLSFWCTLILRVHVFIGDYTFDCSLGNWSHIELRNLFFFFSGNFDNFTQKRVLLFEI